MYPQFLSGHTHAQTSMASSSHWQSRQRPAASAAFVLRGMSRSRSISRGMAAKDLSNGITACRLGASRGMQLRLTVSERNGGGDAWLITDGACRMSSACEIFHQIRMTGAEPVHATITEADLSLS